MRGPALTGSESRRARPGIFAWFGIPIPFPDRVRLIRDAGFEVTSLWWEERHPEARRLRHRAPDLAREAGLEVDHIHVPYRGCNDLWSAHDGDRAEAVARHVRWIGDCARHAIPVMVMHAVSGRGNQVRHAHGLDSMSRILEAAAHHGVTVALENTRRNDLLDLMLDHFPVPHLGLCYDNAHDALHDATPLALLLRRRERLTTTHISDCDRKRDQHWIPGEGVLDFDVLQEALGTYRGTRLLEVVPKDRAEAPEPFLRRAYAAALGQVEALL